MNEPIRILIVEDVDTDFELAQREIRKLVKECIFQRVETRQDFLRSLQTFKPDLILSDYKLPRFNGRKALELAQANTPLTPFIIWTGSMSEDVAVDCMRAGANNYIIKENIKRLGPAVQHALKEGQLLLERKKAEERFQSIFENSPMGIFQSTPEGRYLRANPALARIYGYASPQEMIETVTDIARQIYADPRDRDDFSLLIESEGAVMDLEMRNRRRDGSLIWTSTSTRAVRDTDDRLLYYEGFSQDITERKQAEIERQALMEITQGLVNTKDLQEFLRLIHRSIGKVIHAENFFVVFLNKATGLFEEIYTVDKYDPPAAPSALEKSITSYVFRTGEPLILTQALFDELAARGEVELVGTNSASWMGAPLRTPNGPIGVIVVQDYENPNRYTERDMDFMVSTASQAALAIERKQSEAKLQASESRYRLATRSTMDVIWEWNFETQHLLWSENGYQVFGYTAEEIGPDDTWWDECLHPADRQRVVSRLDELIKTAGGESVWSDEYRFRRKDGSYAYISDHAYIERDHAGRTIRMVGAMSDITDRKQADEKLLQSEEQYRYLFENNPHPMWAYDLKTLAFLAVNDAAVEKYGYTRAEFLNMTIADIRPAEDMSRLQADVAQARPVLQRSGEWRHKLKDGSIIDVEINSHALTLNGREAALVVAQDVTERKQAEDKVRAQEKHFRALIENSLDNISLLAADGTLLWENPAVKRSLGYPQDEFVGRNIFELMHPDDQAWTGKLFAKLVREPGTHQHGTFRLRHHDGSWRWNEAIAANMLKEPSVQAIVINYRDVTERKLAEIELEQRNNDLALINAINEAVIRGESLDSIARLLAKELKRIFSSEGSTIYMLDPDGKSVTMQQFFLPAEIRRKIEKVIGSTIPLVRIPLKEGGFFHKILMSRQGLITSDPREIQTWMSEFAETEFLPEAARGSVRKLIPQIFRLLKIKSTITVPLISDGRAIGLIDVSSAHQFSADDLQRVESLSRQLTAAIHRQQADEKLRRSEKFLQGVQNSLSAHIAILNENGIIIQVNAAWRKFAEQNGLKNPGYGMGSNYLEVCDSALGINAEEAPLAARAIRDVLTGMKRTAWVEYPCHSPEEKRWFLLRVTRFHDGDQTWVVLAHENITERKQAEESFRESSEQFRTLFDASPEAIMLIEPVGGWLIMDCNDAACRMNGYTRAELIGQPVDILNAEPATSESRAEYLDRIINTDVLRYETIHRRKDGHLFPIEVSTSLIKLGGRDMVLGMDRDISDRKQAEENLRESEERYRALFEDSPVSIWEEDFSEVKKYLDALKAEGVTDLQKYLASKPEALYECAQKIKVTDVNNAAMQLYHARSKTELIELTDHILSTGDQEHNLEDFLAIAEGRLENSWDGKDETLTGFPLEISLKWSVVPGHEDDYSKVLVTVTDITARKQAEKSLRESEERYRILISQLPAVVYTDEAVHGIGVTRFVSQQIENILGFTPEEWVTGGFELWKNQIHPEDRSRVVEQYLASIQRGEPFNWEYRIRTKAGGTLWVLDQSKTLFDPQGQPLSSHGIIYDITDRKQAEKTLRESEERFSSAFEFAPIGKALVGLDGRWLKVNPAICGILGYASDELMQMTFQDITHPDDLDADLGMVAQLQAGQIDTYQMEKRYKHKQGHYIWALLSVSLIRDEAGDPAYFIAQIQDITERRSVEENNQERLLELEALYENGLAISQILDPKLVSQKVAEVLAEKLHWHHVAIRLYDAKTNQLEVTALRRPGLNQEQLQEEMLQLNRLVPDADKGLTGWVIKQRQPLRNDYLQQDPRYVESYPGMRSGLYVPILAGDRVLGAISVESDQEQAFTEQDERLLMTLANQAAIAIENAQLYLMVQTELGVRQQTERRLRESEARQNGIIEAAMDGIVTVDETQNIVLFNVAAENIFGYPAKEAIGKPLEMFIPERFRVTHRSHIRQFGETGITTRNMNALGEVSGLRSDGREFPLEASISQITVAGIKLYTIILRDITERKQAEEALRASEEEYRLLAEKLEVRVNERTAEVQDLYDNAPCGYHSLDADGHIVRVNQTELDWMGYTREEIMGLPFEDFLTDESCLVFQENFPAFKKLGWVKDLELDLQRRNGSAFAVAVSSTAVYDKDGNYLTSRSTLFDNTDRKYALDTLRLANEEMKRALRTKDEFLANMSHELRTPLNAILGLSESLLEQTAGPLNERQQKYLGTVNESGRHLLELINDILDLAKVEAGQITLNPGKVDIKTVCQSSLRMIQQLAKEKNQGVELEVGDNIGYIWADERRLKQMIVNLLSNAVKFTPEGGKLGLLVQVDRTSSQALITVWDNGIGIREDDLTRLFLPFVQLDSSLARESSGTGLGLALVAQMARLHGGSISVSSQPGEGSRFTILLPWEPTITGEAMEKLKITGRFPAIKTMVGDKKTILIVEDTDSVVMLIKDYLELSGYHVEVAQDGMAGVTKAIALHPDLILMDVQMPGMDGLEATRHIRKEPTLRDTPILALTALAMSSDRERCLEAGMNDYLSKPVKLKDLVKTIQGHLSETGRVA